jgi:CheY-like chemotaxis protein
VALIEVEDNGHGMDPATMDRVFEPFFTTKQGEGTGLGLSLSRTIVKAHGGRIEARSAPEEGTRFRVTIPVAPGAPPAAEEVPQVRNGTRSRVLVVDDEPSLRVLVQRLVARLGHHCSVAADGPDALALAAANDFDLVICDYRLAGKTADTVVEGLLEMAPRLHNRIVIATGATTDPGVLALAQRHNLSLLAKPYGVDELARIIECAARRAAG